jgi:hypothetical protein
MIGYDDQPLAAGVTANLHVVRAAGSSSTLQFRPNLPVVRSSFSLERQDIEARHKMLNGGQIVGPGRPNIKPSGSRALGRWLIEELSVAAPGFNPAAVAASFLPAARGIGCSTLSGHLVLERIKPPPRIPLALVDEPDSVRSRHWP